MKIVGSRYFHPNIVFREMSLTTLLCMVKHSASVGHQVQHATWPEPRPAHCCCQRGKWFVCGVDPADWQPNKHIFWIHVSWCYWMNRLFEEPLSPVSASSFYCSNTCCTAELCDLLLCLYPPSLHGLCCCKPAQCRAPSDSQGYHPTSTATIYWYRSPLMSVENEIVFEYFSMQLFYTVNLLSTATDRVDVNISNFLRRSKA